MKCSKVSGSISSQRPVFFLSNSAVKGHDSQAYRNMEMTRERISFTFDPIDTLLFLPTGFSFVRAAVACAILERISGLEPSSETTVPRYLNLVTVPNFCPFTFISLWMPHTFVSSSADSGGAFVSYWRKYVQEVLVNRLGGLSLPRKSVVRLTDCRDMTLAVFRGRKTTTQ